MQYVQTQTASGLRRVEIPNAIVAQGDEAVAKYAAHPPKDAVFVEPLPTDLSPAPVATDEE